MKIDLRTIYRFDPVAFQGELPKGGDIYYECACGTVVSSVSFTPVKCECGNVAGNKGEVAVQDPQKIKPMRGKLR